MRPGPTGLHPYLDNFIRLSKLPVATIAEIRGRSHSSITAVYGPIAGRGRGGYAFRGGGIAPAARSAGAHNAGPPAPGSMIPRPASPA
jgi:hypothetical protein